MLRALTSTLYKQRSHSNMLSQETCLVGQPIAWNHPGYIRRQVDYDLLSATLDGELCSVLSPPQTGKSSLCIRIRQQLSRASYQCVSFNATQLLDSPKHYYRWDQQLISLLWDSLFPGELKPLQQWLKETQSQLPQQRLEKFSRYLLSHAKTKESIVIFIDDIEALLDIPFLSNDLFEWIWHCHCLRKIYPEYRRLRFVVVGSAQLSSLTQNKRLIERSRVVAPSNFTLDEICTLKQYIQDYIEEPQQVLEGIFRWTNGQPLLTSKLYKLVSTHLKKTEENRTFPLSPFPAALDQWIDHAVQTDIIDTCWQQDDLSFLRSSWHRLNQSRYKRQLRDLYHNILVRDPVKLDSNPIQSELLLSGLAIAKGNELHIGSEIYRHVFMPLL